MHAATKKSGQIWLISREKGDTDNDNDIYTLLRPVEGFTSETWIVLHDSIEKRWGVITMVNDTLVADI